MSTLRRIITPAVTGAFALVLGAGISFGLHPGQIAAQDRSPAVQQLRDMSEAFVHIADSASPAVVFIDVESKVSARNADMPMGFRNDDPLAPFFRFFERPGQPNRPMPPQMRRGQGSGFIISPDGYVVTNGHVVNDAERIDVTLGDGRRFKAKLVGVDKPTDIAVIKIDDGELPYLTLGDSDALRIGEIVVAIGNPFGLSHSVTQGIVSAKGRSGVGITDYADFIQTDAAINPGNSGGPLLNLEGEVVGMNTAILSRTGGSLGIGFAIPINNIKEIKDTLISGKAVERGFLGVMIQDVTPDMAEYFKAEPNKGALIAELGKDSPATGTLEQDDIVLELDGRPVKDAASLRNMVAMSKPGTQAEMRVLRDGEERNVTVTLGKRDEEQTRIATEEAEPSELGLGLQNLTLDLAQQLGFGDQKGVVITRVEPGSAAQRAGLQPGMLIQEVNRDPVNNVAEFRKFVAESDGDVVLLRFTDGSRSLYTTLRKE